MSHQSVVTNYFARKRQRVVNQPSKRLKILDHDASTLKDKFASIEKSAENLKQVIHTRRVTRSSVKKHAFKSSNAEIEKVHEISSASISLKNKVSVPAENILELAPCHSHGDNLPEKRNLSDIIESPAKRGRIAPQKDHHHSAQTHTRKVGFIKSNVVKEKRQAKRQLLLPVVWKNADELISTQRKQENTEEIDYSTRKNETLNSNASSTSQLQEVQHETKQPEEILLEKSSESAHDFLKGKDKLSKLQDALLKMKQLKKLKKSGQKESTPDSNHKAKKIERTKREFAFTKYHTLAQEIPKDLILPLKYKILQEMFRSVDTIVSMLFNRQQTTTWVKLQKSVEEMLRRKFQQDNLRQIKHVFPDAYRFRQENGIPTVSNSIKKSDYQLVLEPIIDNFESAMRKKLTGSMLVQRRHHFHIQLLEIVKLHHQKFLSTLNPPAYVDAKQLRRWHPEFPLEDVPDVPMSDLPQHPNVNEQKCHSAKDVLDIARDRLTKKATEALLKVAERHESSTKVVPVSKESNNNFKYTTSNRDIKGISASLLVKIRAKEAERKMKEMIRSDEQVNKINQLRSLPSIARSLKTLYVSEKRSSLPLDFICSKLVSTCPSVPTQESMQEHLRLLSKSTIPWFVITTNRSKDYGKLNKDEGICGILAKLEALVVQAEKD